MESPGDLLVPYVQKITKEFKECITKSHHSRVYRIKYTFTYTKSGLVAICEYRYNIHDKSYGSSITKVYANKIKGIFESKNVSEVIINLQRMSFERVDAFDFVLSDLFSVVQVSNMITTTGLRIEYCLNPMISNIGYLSKWDEAGQTSKVMPNWENIKNSLYNCFYGDTVIQDSGDNTFVVTSNTYNHISSKNLSEDWLNACYSLLKGLSNVRSLKRKADNINTIIVLNHCCNDKILYRLLGNGEYEIIVSFK